MNNSFTKGPILKPLIKFALPVLLALILQAMYGAVDLLVVGQFGGAADVSAVSNGSQIMQFVTSVITGMSMGATILIGQRIGEGRKKEAGGVIGASVCLFAAMTLVITVLFIVFAPQIAAAINTPPEAVDKAVTYVRICSAGAIFITAYNVFGSIFRGLGDSKTPLITVAIACCVNIVGDLWLVGGLGMNAAGAAIATVAAQAISVLVSLIIIRKNNSLGFKVRREDIRWNKQIIGRVTSLGFPIALQDGLVSLSFIFINAIVNTLGVVASAGVGVAEKLCTFILLVPSAYMQSLSAFVAQNVGAGEEKRARQAMFYAMMTSLAFGAVICIFTFFKGDLLAGLFAKDSDVIAAAWEYLKAYSIDSLFVSFLFCYVGYFNGIGKTRLVMIQGLAGAFLIRIPFTYVFSHIQPVSLFRIGLAIPLATVLQIVVCTIYYMWLRKHQESIIAI